MKFAEEIFPMGTFDQQKTAGAYIDQTLAINLNTYAKKIANDMHFTLVIGGNDSVGNGKTTLATHTGCYLTHEINKRHKVKNTFTAQNMVFKSKDLIKRSFELPKYSVIVLDEGDDITENHLSDIMRNLKKYFNKCRQLNQIIILIMPMFFEIKRFFALGRTHCLINVKFMGEFDRGYFDFYGPESKKKLYLKGKREWDYNAWPKDFSGRFFKSYSFFPNCREETEKYLVVKRDDIHEDEDEELSNKELAKLLKIHFVDKAREELSWSREEALKFFCLASTTYYDNKNGRLKNDKKLKNEILAPPKNRVSRATSNSITEARVDDGGGTDPHTNASSSLKQDGGGEDHHTNDTLPIMIETKHDNLFGVMEDLET